MKCAKCLCDFVNDGCDSVILPLSSSPGKDRGPWYHLHSGCPPLTCCTGSHAVPDTASSLYPPATDTVHSNALLYWLSCCTRHSQFSTVYPPAIDTVKYSLMPCCTGFHVSTWHSQFSMPFCNSHSTVQSNAMLY